MSKIKFLIYFGFGLGSHPGPRPNTYFFWGEMSDRYAFNVNCLVVLLSRSASLNLPFLRFLFPNRVQPKKTWTNTFSRRGDRLWAYQKEPLKQESAWAMNSPITFLSRL